MNKKPIDPRQTKTFNQISNQIFDTRSKFEIRTLNNNRQPNNNVDIKNNNNNIDNDNNDNNNRIAWTATRQIGTSINWDEFDPRRLPRKFATPLPPPEFQWQFWIGCKTMHRPLDSSLRIRSLRICAFKMHESETREARRGRNPTKSVHYNIWDIKYMNFICGVGWNKFQLKMFIFYYKFNLIIKLIL